MLNIADRQIVAGFDILAVRKRSASFAKRQGLGQKGNTSIWLPQSGLMIELLECPVFAV